MKKSNILGFRACLTGIVAFLIMSCSQEGIVNDTPEPMEDLSDQVDGGDQLDDPYADVTIQYPQMPGSFFFDGRLEGADYWSEEARILSATLGFCDIVGVQGAVIDQQLAEAAGAAWRSDVSCENGGQTMMSLQSQISLAYIVQSPYGELKDGALGLDGLPVVFSWPVDTSTVELTDFRLILNTGEVVYPMAIGAFPNVEINERNTIVLYGEFANKLPSDDPNSRFPARIEVIDDATPMILIGPNNQKISAVGMSWENSSSPYDENNGPRLVGAKLNRISEGTAIGEGTGVPLLDQQTPANDEYALYGGGDFRLRTLTSGGFSTDGVGGILPTDFENFFRLHAHGEDGSTVLLTKTGTDYSVKGGTIRILGLSDLGAVEGNGIVYDECYQEDGDNYIDIILVGDEEAVRNITFVEIPSLEGGYSAFYNPGGPGSTPVFGENYTQPGPPDMEPVIMALDNPMRVNN